MNVNQTNFTEASLAEQSYSNEDEAKAKAPAATANLSNLLRRLTWNEPVPRGGFAAGFPGVNMAKADGQFIPPVAGALALAGGIVVFMAKPKCV